MKHPTRTLKELYVILLDSYITNVQNYGSKTFSKSEKRYSYFICNHITDLADNSIITAHEKNILLGDFQSQRPTKTLHVEFYKHKKFYKRPKSLSWWKFDRFEGKGIEEKVKFLTYLVSIQTE